MEELYSFYVTYAYDVNGNRHLVSKENIFSDRCGYFHARLDVRDTFYEVIDDIRNDCLEKKGTTLPLIGNRDYKSYFTSLPTQGLQTILQLAGLHDLVIAYFLVVRVDKAEGKPCYAESFRISKNMVVSCDYDLCEKELEYSSDNSNEIEAIMDALVSQNENYN